MKPHRLLALLGTVAIAASACTDGPDVAAPDASIAPAPGEALLSRGPGAGPAGQMQNFVAPHSGDQEVPVRETSARGLAHFQLSKDGSELRYQLNVANIRNVLQAHIHCGPPGANGPIIVWLYPSEPPAQLIEGRSDGVLSRGVATDADVVQVEEDHPACPGGVSTLADVVERMRNGDAYSNVHTQQFPPGEIRGDIRAGGPHH